MVFFRFLLIAIIANSYDFWQNLKYVLFHLQVVQPSFQIDIHYNYEQWAK